MDLKNIAINRIFEMGYDVEKHGNYDKSLKNSRYNSTHRERIGKKYQWIALYELAAQVSDNYEMEVNDDDHGAKKKIYCKGSFEPNIRNIDPTIKTLNLKDQKTEIKPIHELLYSFPDMSNSEWLLNFDDIPQVSDLIYRCFDKSDFVMLDGMYTWKEEKKLGFRNYKQPQKDMWVMVKSYIVKKDDSTKFYETLKKSDFMGRWMPEASKNTVLYNKEYYWSESFKFYENPYYCGDEWVNIEPYHICGVNLNKVLIPVKHYMTERQGDVFNENCYNWCKPCSEIFNGLDLKYGKENTGLYDKNGKLICFDTCEILNEDIGLLINKTKLVTFLREKNYVLFWTVLGEKRISQDPINRSEKYEMPSISGVYYLDDVGEINGYFKQYD